MNALPPTQAEAFTPATFTRRHKAAVVVKLLISEGIELSLEGLPDDVQVALTQTLSEMRNVDQRTLHAIADEFSTELDSLALSFSGGVDGALSLLDGRISRTTADRMKREAAAGKSIEPWDRIRQMEVDTLLPVLETESVEVGAVVLSKLPVKRAAEILGRLPGERARRITYAVSMTTAVTPQAVARIGQSLVEQLESLPIPAFSDAPVDRVGAILNSSGAAIRDDVLGGLTEADADFAEQVRKAIFTFANIAERLEARDIAKLTRDVDAAVLVTALAAALAAEGPTPVSAEFILDNMSQRMAAQLREEVEERGKVKAADGENAMGSVVETIRNLESAGEIKLIELEEEE